MDDLFTVADQLMEANASVGEWLGYDMSAAIGSLLVVAFGVAVGFVAYKLIKRALNKA